MLSTPPCDDAVSFGYGVMAYSGTDLHRTDKAPLRAHSFPRRRESMWHPRNLDPRFRGDDGNYVFRNGCGLEGVVLCCDKIFLTEYAISDYGHP